MPLCIVAVAGNCSWQPHSGKGSTETQLDYPVSRHSRSFFKKIFRHDVDDSSLIDLDFELVYPACQFRLIQTKRKTRGVVGFSCIEFNFTECRVDNKSVRAKT